MRAKLFLLSAAGLAVALVFGSGVARDNPRASARDHLSTHERRGLTPLDGRAGSGIVGPAGQRERTASAAVTGALRGTRGPRAAGKALDAGPLQKATTLLRMASRAEQPHDALTLLMQVLDMDIPRSPEGDRLIASAHYRLAGLYEHPAKQAHHLKLASRHARSDAQRQRLAEKANALGGDGLVEIEQLHDSPHHGILLGDACEVALPAGSFSTSGDHFTARGLSVRGEDDAEWFALNVDITEPGTGLSFRVQTLSDTPGSTDDDSILELWSGCGASDRPSLIGFADDQGGNAPLTSTLTTSCLGPGAYFLNVKSFPGAQANNIDLQIEAATACALAEADTFEPDNSREEATPLDLRATTAGHSPRPVRDQAASAIQVHSVYPAGDEDWVQFELKQDSLVRFRTVCGSAIGDDSDVGCDDPAGFDTLLELYYASETTTGGLCNQTINPTDAPGLIDGRSSNACVTDLDCDTDGDGLVYPEDLDDLQNPFEGLPACLPWTVFGASPVDPVDNPLAFSDDAAFPVNLGADMTLCLPKTRGNRAASLSVAADPAPKFNWYVRTGGWSPDDEIANSTLTFDYSLLVDTLGGCVFETEPNNAFRDRADGDDDDDDDQVGGRANRLALGQSIHGIWDFSATQPTPDVDLYEFDVTEPSAVLFEIDGFDPIAVDTFIEIVVGPDDDGNYFLTGDRNDDVSASDLRSRLEVFLPPACEMLNNCLSGDEATTSEAESAYFLNVTSAFVVPNFPYELKSAVIDGVAGELDDFGDVGSGTEASFGVGQRYLAGFDEVCDVDAYRFSLDDSTFVRLATGPSGADTVLELRDCETGDVLACDDDSGPGFQSAMEGCLPGGRDYCVRVRSWDGTNTFAYSLEATGGEACDAEDPPLIDAGGSATCDMFDTCP